MANDIEPKKYPPDFSPDNIRELEEYKTNGLPGIPTNSEKIDAVKKLYLEGLSFNMISNQTRVKRAAVLYLAEKYGWYDERETKIVGMLESVGKRTDMFSVQHVHFVIELCDAIRAYYLDKIRRYADTKDPTIMENLSGTLMNIYTKCVDSLKTKGVKDDDLPKNPLVGITLGEGATLSIPQKKYQENDDLSKALKALADMNRLKDNN